MAGDGTWLLIQELLERGDPTFVDELRRVHDAEALGTFANRWYADRRPASRRLLLEYLGRPLNAFRHESLVKRLFKLAETAGDDEVMGRFLVLFDRSIRRRRRTRKHREVRQVANKEEAEALVQRWKAEGFTYVNYWRIFSGGFQVSGTRPEVVITMPRGSTMPNDKVVESWGFVGLKYQKIAVPEWLVRLGLTGVRPIKGEFDPSDYRGQFEKFRLFKPATRQYLRRRAWRYFRRLGRLHPERFVAALTDTLPRFEDADVADEIALLDNWGLIHALFHHCPALAAKPTGWEIAAGHSLAELVPAPYYRKLWEDSPRAVVGLVAHARCRPVRRWALVMAGRVRKSIADVLTLEDWLGLLGHDDSEVVAWAADGLRGAEGLDQVTPGRWLALLETDDPMALEIIGDLVRRHLRADRITIAEAAGLARRRPLPVARLGLDLLRGRTPRDESECRALLGLLEAEAVPIRPEILQWLRAALAGSADFQADWVLEFLDSRHADARAVGWDWLRAEPRARNDIAIWRKLLESPDDDLRLNIVSELESRLDGHDATRDNGRELDSDLLRFFWASVLLNVQRGGRAKPTVLRQLLGRIERRPEELPRLLPLLGVALRSVRGPEWRAGLATVVRLAERRPEALPAVREAFPELTIA